MPIMRVPEPSARIFNIPSTGGGTFVLLHRYSATQGGTPNWFVEAAEFLDDSNNATSISAHDGGVTMSITRENGVAHVAATYSSYNYDESWRCCFIPGNPFVGPVEPA